MTQWYLWQLYFHAPSLWSSFSAPLLLETSFLHSTRLPPLWLILSLVERHQGFSPLFRSFFILSAHWPSALYCPSISSICAPPWNPLHHSAQLCRSHYRCSRLAQTRLAACAPSKDSSNLPSMREGARRFLSAGLQSGPRSMDWRKITSLLLII